MFLSWFVFVNMWPTHRWHIWHFDMFASCTMSRQMCRRLSKRRRVGLRHDAGPVSTHTFWLVGDRKDWLRLILGKMIYHSAVALNAFQMMCPWDARLVLSLSSPARNSLCNHVLLNVPDNWKVLLTCVECVVTQEVCLPFEHYCQSEFSKKRQLVNHVGKWEMLVMQKLRAEMM